MTQGTRIGDQAWIGAMRRNLFAACLLVVWATFAGAEDRPFRYTTFGAPGLIEMPKASSASDAELALTVSRFADETRSAVQFQLTPRLSAGFRYSALSNVDASNGETYERLLDRSFSLHYQLLEDTQYWPSLTVGVTDFVGTGVYASEYLVASKALHPAIDVTIGLGWGRLAGAATGRPETDFGQGGTTNFDALFQGTPDVFGGLHWQNDRLGLTLEYSTDTYPTTVGDGFDQRSPINLGANYAVTSGLHLAAQYLHGSEFGAQLTYVLNPLQPPFGTGLSLGPDPVRETPQLGELASYLEEEGLRLIQASRDGPLLRIVVENKIHPAPAQAVGRAVRVLANHAPPAVSDFEIALSENGMVGSSVLVSRGDVRATEFLTQPPNLRFRPSDPVTKAESDFELNARPYLTANLFDPDDPLRADFGVELAADWSVGRGIILSGALRQKVGGNLDQTLRMSDSVLPRVRSDFALYDQEGDADLIRMTGAIYRQPDANLYTKLTVGALEEMFAGVSAELLWRPAASDWAVGAEFNHVWQRGYESDFDLLDYEVTTGHGSIYWTTDAGYAAQLDLGRYLAGDWGGTLTLSRIFANGWSIGAFATLTDIPFDDFGEGSFDKGFVVTVPLSWIGGQPTRDMLKRTIRPVTRDGGARLHVDGRLYDLTRDLSDSAIAESWGMFWR